MSKNLHNKFENFEANPPNELWRIIKLQLPNKKPNWLVISTITGAIILIAVIILFIKTPIYKDIENQDLLLSNYNLKNCVNKEQANLTKSSNIVIDNKKRNTTNLIEKDNFLETNKFEDFVFAINEREEKDNIQISKPKTSYSKFANEFSITPNPKTFKNNILKEVSMNKDIYIEGLTNDSSKNETLSLPNAFSPLDIENNIFKPLYKKVKSYEMNIFNRNGQLLFSSKNISDGWNGYYRGVLCEMATYIYDIRFVDLNGDTHVIRGNFILLRN